MAADQLMDSNGTQRTSCRSCLAEIRERRAAAREELRNNDEDDAEHVDGPVNADGVEHGLGIPEVDGANPIDADQPDDAAINGREAAYLKRFRDAVGKVSLEHCLTCHEKDWNLKVVNGKCDRCRRDRGETKKWSVENGTMPGKKAIPPNRFKHLLVAPSDVEVPECLRVLTDIEEQMIALVHTMQHVRHTRGRQLCYSDHTISFIKDISTIATSLPRLPEDLDYVIIRRMGLDTSHHIDFVVRRALVLEALQWKVANDPAYRHIRIDHQALATLPERGSVLSRLQQVDDTSPVGADETNNPAPGPVAAAGDALVVDLEGGNDGEAIVDNNIRGLLNLEVGGVHRRREVQEVREGADVVLRYPMHYEQRHIVSQIGLELTRLGGADLGSPSRYELRRSTQILSARTHPDTSPRRSRPSSHPALAISTKAESARLRTPSISSTSFDSMTSVLPAILDSPGLCSTPCSVSVPLEAPRCSFAAITRREG